MLSQKSAEQFVRAWCLSKSVQQVAEALGRPVQTVRRQAAFLVEAGVNLPARPESAPPAAGRDLSLTPDQKRLFAEHLDLVAKVVAALGKNNPLVARLGDDAHQVGLMALARAAQNFRPGRGAQFPTYASVVVRDQVTREASRYFGPGGRKAGGDPDRVFVAEGRAADPADELVRAEERQQVAGVIGPIDLGSAQGKNRAGQPNYADLCGLAERAGVDPTGLTRDELLAVVASAIRARMLKPSVN